MYEHVHICNVYIDKKKTISMNVLYEYTLLTNLSFSLVEVVVDDILAVPYVLDVRACEIAGQGRKVGCSTTKN